MYTFVFSNRTISNFLEIYLKFVHATVDAKVTTFLHSHNRTAALTTRPDNTFSA